MVILDEILNTFYCFVTKEKLFDIHESGKIIRHTSYGQCEICNEYIILRELHHPSGNTKDSWPVVYKGLTCKVCEAKGFSKAP